MLVSREKRKTKEMENSLVQRDPEPRPGFGELSRQAIETFLGRADFSKITLPLAIGEIRLKVGKSHKTRKPLSTMKVQPGGIYKDPLNMQNSEASKITTNTAAKSQTSVPPKGMVKETKPSRSTNRPQPPPRITTTNLPVNLAPPQTSSSPQNLASLEGQREWPPLSPTPTTLLNQTKVKMNHLQAKPNSASVGSQNGLAKSNASSPRSRTTLTSIGDEKEVEWPIPKPNSPFIIRQNGLANPHPNPPLLKNSSIKLYDNQECSLLSPISPTSPLLLQKGVEISSQPTANSTLNPSLHNKADLSSPSWQMNTLASNNHHPESIPDNQQIQSPICFQNQISKESPTAPKSPPLQIRNNGLTSTYQNIQSSISLPAGQPITYQRDSPRPKQLTATLQSKSPPFNPNHDQRPKHIPASPYSTLPPHSLSDTKAKSSPSPTKMISKPPKSDNRPQSNTSSPKPISPPPSLKNTGIEKVAPSSLVISGDDRSDNNTQIESQKEWIPLSPKSPTSSTNNGDYPQFITSPKSGLSSLQSAIVKPPSPPLIPSSDLLPASEIIKPDNTPISPQSAEAPSSSPQPTKAQQPKSWAELVKSSPAINVKAAATAAASSTNGNKSTSPNKQAKAKGTPTNGRPKVGGLAGVLQNFQPIYKNSLLQPRGLVNNGNTCFMNAILQPLSHCPPFYNLLMRIEKEVPHNFNNKNPLLDSLIIFMTEFQEVKDDIENGEDFGEPFAPEYVYDALRRTKKFDSMKGRQEDAEEFLGFLLDGLHEEFLAAIRTQGSRSNNYIPNGHVQEAQGQKYTSSTNQITNNDGWFEVGQKNKQNITRSTDIQESPVSRIFGGQVRYVLRCPGSSDSITLQPFSSLQLDIQPDDVKTVEDALLKMNVPEIVHDYCSPKNGIVVEANKRLYLDKLPPILILHLKRFVYDNVGGTQKLNKTVGYSTNITIPSDLISQAQRQRGPINYRLFGVVYHHGKSATGGHYTCDILRQNNSWLHVDDATITTITGADVIVTDTTSASTDRLAYFSFCTLSSVSFSKVSSWSRHEDSSIHTNHSLFFSFPTNDAEADTQEAIPLQNSRQLDYIQYPDDYSASEIDSPLLSHVPDNLDPTSQTPGAFYLDVHQTNSMNDLRNTLTEGLLPSTMIPPSLLAGPRKRQFKDPFFALLFFMGLFVVLITGIIFLLKTNSLPIEEKSHAAVYRVIRDSKGLLIFSILFSLLIGGLWITILSSYVEVIFKTLIGVALTSAGILLWILAEFLAGTSLKSGKSDPQNKWLAFSSVIPLAIIIIYLRLIYYGRESIQKTVKVIQLACGILKDNPLILGVSYAILASYILFTVLWLIFLSRLFLIGHMMRMSGDSIWVVDHRTYFLIGFYLFMYLWGSAVFSNIQRITLASVVSHWYFHRDEDAPTSNQRVIKAAITRATTTSFGTVCLGALMLSIVQTLRLVTSFLKKRLRGRQSKVFTCFSYCLRCFEGIIDNLNNYTLIYAGISGESFCSSAYFTTKIFRRNLVFGLITDLITKFVLYVGSVLIALICGVATFVFATNSLHSSYGYVVGIIATIVPYYISQFYTSIMMNTIDATFMCYIIDLDTNINNLKAAHDAFSDDR
ncbi:hypothetical protein G9A89_018101 [Geosiphon pyriformis]|nr:hypothetical protein G9A89_018101 [Geosiphon pyriformis]